MHYKNHIISLSVSLLFALLLSAGAWAQDKPQLKATLDKDSILIGDHVTLSLTVTHSKLQHAGFPILPDTIFQGLELVRELKLDTLNENDREISLEKKYIITSFDSATYQFTLPFVLQKDKVFDTIESNPVTLYVNTIPIDTATYQLADIKAPIEYPYTFKEFLPWIILSVAILLLVSFILYVLWRRKKNKPIFTKPKPVEPPYVTAIRELNKLKEQKVWQQENAKQYYTRLTDILRAYIEREFLIPTMEKTSQEIMQLILQSPLVEKYPQERLNELFRTSDLAKFAKYRPAADENERSLTIAYDFVEATKPVQLAEQPIEEANDKPKEAQEDKL